jgi:dUTPase
MKGLHLFSGVIDSDFLGEIRVMAHTLKAILTFTPEQKIAQLILISCLLGSTKALSEESCATKGFGSSDRAYWIQQLGQNRPELELKINGKKNLKA